METDYINNPTHTVEDEKKEKKLNGQNKESKLRTGATIGAAAVVGGVAGATASHAFGQQPAAPVEEPSQEQPQEAAAPEPTPQPEPVPETAATEEPVVTEEPVATEDATPTEPPTIATDESAPASEAVADATQPDTAPEVPSGATTPAEGQEVADAIEVNPDEEVDDIIRGEYVDPADQVDDQVVRIDEVGQVEIEGNEYNAVLATGPDGNPVVFVDVDGVPGDPNGTMDVVIDPVTGSFMPLPQPLTVADALALQQNGEGVLDANTIGQPDWYSDPDTQVAMNEMPNDIIDPNDLRV